MDQKFLQRLGQRLMPGGKAFIGLAALLMTATNVGAYTNLADKTVLATGGVFGVTATTWDTIGLDSNAPAKSGPDTFPVGARLCNFRTGFNLTSVKAVFSPVGVDGSAINLSPGSLNTQVIPVNLPSTTLAAPQLASCVDVYFEVVVTRSLSSFTKQRTFNIAFDVNWADGTTVSLTAPRALYVEKLVSQNRNAIVDVKFNTQSVGASTTVTPGQTIDIELSGKTSTAYPELETFLNLPSSIFEILSYSSSPAYPGVQSQYPVGPSYSSLNPLNNYVSTNMNDSVGPSLVPNAGYENQVPPAPPSSRGTTLWANGCRWDYGTVGYPLRGECGDAVNGSSPQYGGGVNPNYVFMRYKVRVRPDAPGGSSFNLNALFYDFSGSSFHYNADYGSTARIVTVQPVPQPPANSVDLKVEKVVTSVTGSLAAGGTVTFAVNVTNLSNNPATGVVVSDPTLVGSAYDSFSCVSAGSPSGCANYTTAASPFTKPFTSTWAAGDFAAGQTKTLVITATFAATGLVENVVNTVSVSSTQPDTDPANNIASVTPDFPSENADLAVTKTASTLTPTVGSPVDFTLTVTNNGVLNATGVVLSDEIPEGFSYPPTTVSGSGFACLPAPSRVCTWTVGSLAGQNSATVVISANVVGGQLPAEYTNSVLITGSNQGDDVEENNQAEVTVIPQPAADPATTVDLLTTKTVLSYTPPVFPDANRGTVTFQVTVTNLNQPTDAAAAGVVVNDLLPSGYAITTPPPSATLGSYNSSTGVWIVGTLNGGATATLTLTATVNAEGNLVNVATATSTTPDRDPNNNSASATPTIAPLADIGVTKQVSNDEALVGEIVEFTIIATNHGPSNATGVQFTDNLPTGYVFVGATPSPGTTFASGTWNVGALDNGDSALLKIQARVVNPSSPVYVNQVSLSASSTADPNPDNNVATATTFVPVADIEVNKWVDKSEAQPGDVVEYTVLVTNNGPDPVTGGSAQIVIQDLLPTGVGFLSVALPDINPKLSQGSYDDSDGKWSGITLAVGQTATMKIRGTVGFYDPSYSFINTARVFSSTLPDPDSSNNGASAGIGVNDGPTNTPSADLSVVKYVDNESSGVVEYTVLVTNNGPDTANAVQLMDPLPNGYQFISATASIPTSYSQPSGQWDVGTLIKGQSQTLKVVALVLNPNPNPLDYTNVARISNSSAADPNSLNNTASVQLGPQRADLGVTKSVRDGFSVGSVIFDLEVRNYGPSSPAENVRVLDPATGYTSCASSGATLGSTFTDATGEWVIPSLSVGSVARVTLTCAAPSGYTTNTAVITSSSLPDPNSINNTASATPAANGVRLDVSKVINGSTLETNVGDSVSYTVTLRNTGTTNATGVHIVDPIPFGLQYVSHSVSTNGGTYDRNNGDWLIPSIPAGETRTLTVVGRVIYYGVHWNVAQIVATNEPRLDNNGDYAIAGLTVTPPPAPIPTLPEWAMMLMAFMALGLAHRGLKMRA